MKGVAEEIKYLKFPISVGKERSALLPLLKEMFVPDQKFLLLNCGVRRNGFDEMAFGEMAFDETVFHKMSGPTRGR